MKDFVSGPWINVAGLAAAMSVVCVVLVQYGYPWTGLALLSVALSAPVVVALRPGCSMSELVRDVEAEPARAAALKGRGTP